MPKIRSNGRCKKHHPHIGRVASPAVIDDFLRILAGFVAKPGQGEFQKFKLFICGDNHFFHDFVLFRHSRHIS